MKTKLLLGLLLIGGMTSVNAQTQIADFESGSFGENGLLEGSFSSCYIDGNAIESFEIVANPETTGLNTSSKVLKVVNKSGEGLDWWGGLTMILEAPITADAQNRYLHIMVKCQNVGNLQNFHFNLYPMEGEVWTDGFALANAQDKWFDYVIDLQNRADILRALRFQARPDNVNNQGNTLYIDDIILSGDSNPREAAIEPTGVIADFEDGTLNAFEECVIEGDGVTSFEVVDNPETAGLNTSGKALKVINGNGEDWGGLKMKLAEPIVASENRYIHIMMKFENIGIQNFHFAVFSNTIEKWSLLTNARSEWFDYVIDLNDVEGTAIDSVVSLRYLPRSANYTNPGNVVHIDEIIVNNDPTPRGGYNHIDVAGTIADFNDGTLNKLTCIDDGGGVASFEVADNPDASGINASSKALKFVTPSTSGEWWPGLLITFPKPVVVNDDTRYLHIMTYAESDDQTYELAINLTNQHYLGQAGVAAGWKDYVIDLGAYMGQKLAGFRHCTRIDGASNLNKTRYIDEIAVSADPTPRTSGVTSVPENTVQTATIFNSSNGITIQGTEGKFEIYNVSGMLVQTGIATGDTQVNLLKGFYIVKVGSTSYKVSVR